MRNFLIDSGISEQNFSPIAQSDFIRTNLSNKKWAVTPEYEKWGLQSNKEYDLMKYVKDNWWTAEDFTEILEDYRSKTLWSKKTKTEFKTQKIQEKENISWFDIWVKTGKGISSFWKERKTEWVEFPTTKSEWVDFALTTLQNIPWDWLEAIWETIEFVSDPVWAVKSIEEMAQWFVFKGLRKIWKGVTWEDLSKFEEEAASEAAVKYFKDNFGTLDKASKTITENPVDTIFILKNIVNSAKKTNPNIANKFDKVDKSLPKKLNESAKKDIEQALWATKEKYKQMSRDLTEWITERKITWSKQEIQEIAEAQASKYWKQIEDYIDSWKLQWTVQRDDLLNVLDDIRKQGQLDDVIIDENIVNATDKFADAISGFWKEIPAEKARVIRQMLDKAVYSTKWVVSEEALSLKNNIKNQLANALRSELAKQNPELAKINKEFSFYSKLDEVLTETINRQWPQQWWLISNIAWGGWLWAGAVIFWDISWAIATWVALKWLTQAMRSTKWKTISAWLKTQLANALSSGNQSKVTEITNKILKEVYWQKANLYIWWQVTESNLENNE